MMPWDVANISGRPRAQGVNTRWRCKGFNICRDGYKWSWQLLEAQAIQYANTVPSGKHTKSYWKWLI
jgi:hypothetical protein